MVGFNENDTLVLGGYRFSKMHNRKKGILVTSVDPNDTTQSIVLSSKENSAINVSNHSKDEERRRAPRRNSQQRKEIELEKKAWMFCKLVNKLLQSENSSVFAGYEVIYRMVSSGLVKNREEALKLGKDLSKQLRLFHRVEFKRNTFSDDGKLYKFRPDVLLSVIMKAPMSLQKLTPPAEDGTAKRLSSKPIPTNDYSYSAMKFKKFAPKRVVDEPKAEEPSVEMNAYGKPMKKGRRPKAKTQGRSSSSVEDWDSQAHGHPSCEEDESSVYTEVTVSESNHTDTFPPFRTLPQHDIDEDSCMEITVSTRGASIHSYFDEYILDDEDEYDVMSVPTTPVVKEKVKVAARSNLIPINEFFSPIEVMGFDSVHDSSGSRQSSKASRYSSRNMGGHGDLVVGVPFDYEQDEDLLVDY